MSHHPILILMDARPAERPRDRSFAGTGGGSARHYLNPIADPKSLERVADAVVLSALMTQGIGYLVVGQKVRGLPTLPRVDLLHGLMPELKARLITEGHEVESTLIVTAALSTVYLRLTHEGQLPHQPAITTMAQRTAVIATVVQALESSEQVYERLTLHQALPPFRELPGGLEAYLWPEQRDAWEALCQRASVDDLTRALAPTPAAPAAPKARL